LKKLFFILGLFFLSATSMFAEEVISNESSDTNLIKYQSIQNKIDDIGAKILNANSIEYRIIFVCTEQDKKSKLKIEKTLTDRQVVVYQNDYKFIDSEDEMSAFLSRGILYAMKSYRGAFNGYLSALQIKAAPKKFEIVADKRAVDFMVKAGYNPLGLITFIQKSEPQKRFDTVGTKNLASKRLAIIYEYIYTKYPYYLQNNEYLTNEHYQNFLLTSQNNRQLLLQKIKSGSKKELDYE